MSPEMILLVEDSPFDAELALHALRKSNLRNPVTWLRDGAEALDFILNSQQLPLVVLLDLGLPKVDGLEVLARVRAEERTFMLPVIILTGSDDQSNVARSLSEGANAYMVKPVDSARLFNAIQQLGFSWAISGVR
jgi:two-component system, response regulator